MIGYMQAERLLPMNDRNPSSDILPRYKTPKKEETAKRNTTPGKATDPMKNNKTSVVLAASHLV